MPRKITFPHAGDYHIAFKHLFEGLGYEVVRPPPASQRTLDLGVKYSPAQACLPFKITLGNIMEGVDLGANVAAMIVGKTGICRLTYYSEMYKKILPEAGFQVDQLALKVNKEFWQAVKIHNPQLKFRTFAITLRSFWEKLKILEFLRERSLELRPYELNRGSCTRLKQDSLAELEKISDLRELRTFRRRITERFAAIQVDMNRNVLRVGLVGEFFLMIDQFSTMNVEEFLGERGVVLQPSMDISSYFKDSLKQKRFIDEHLPTFNNRIIRMARPYINRPIGGHGRQSVGKSINFSKSGYDGVIHLYPFSCMPEVVASSMMPRVSSNHNIPILSISLDEHTGSAGFQTRIEAFIDTIHRTKFAKA